MEKATSGLELVDLSKQNFRRTLDSLQEGAHSLLLLTVQWKEIEAYFDSTKNVLQERAKELQALEESIKGQALELETKEKELSSIRGSYEAKLSDLEKKEKEFHMEQKAATQKRSGEVEQLERFTERIESMEKFSDEKLKELEARANELELKVKQVQQQKERISAGETLRLEFEPLVSLLAKNIGSSVTMPTNCSTFYLNENATDFADDLVMKNLAFARMIPYLDPAKLVFEAIEGSLKEYLNKDFGEADDRLDSVVNSCIVMLEKLIQMNLHITRNVKEEATQLGIDWIGKAKTNPNSKALVLGCLLFLAAYDLASVTTREVLLTLLERFLLYDQAPKLFRLLGLEDKVSGAVETLRKKEEYLATLKFICEFRSYKLCPRGRPGDLLLEYLDSSEKAARVIAGDGNSVEAQKARREKRKADAVMALECIREKKTESMFPAKILKQLNVLKNDEPAPRAVEQVHKSYEKRRSTTNAVEKSKADSFVPYQQKSEAKRQKLTEPRTHVQNSTVNRPRVVSVPSGDKIEESGVNHQQEATKANYASSTETKPNILPGSINGEMLRELVEKQPLVESDLSNAIKCTPDPAKLVLDTSMALCPKNPQEGYEFKLLVTSASCSLLLDQLKKNQAKIGHPVKGDAKKLAVYWKDKISKSKKDELEVVCFLKFLGIFGIVADFKANDLLSLLDNSYWQTVSPDLCQFLGLDNAIPGFIQNLIKTGHRLKAIDYIYSFGMVRRFHPVSAIINDSLRITKESAEKSFRDAKNESAPQVAAIDRQIRSLRAAIKCISRHKLESEFQLGNLEEQIKSLLKLRRNPSDGSGSGTKPDLTIKQSQAAEEAPNLAEVGSVTSNTPLETSTAAASSSVSKPGSKKKQKRGQKRSLSGSKQSSVHVASDPRNHFPVHGYSLNQRLTWPVDHYDRGLIENPNLDYNYNHWTQPERPRFCQFYQHFDPYNRNQ
ncbi:hypothetical protein EUTSA_v10005503mg [Eutrema salsugineum]|uniref:FRIGIDA-like protein n=2 Tax=Eutrema salsugineum TaxID=72664 RepID=V4K422_EUTSA|nr:hypothetical protein EUTSA_v10005503mg [Eutrema salsugineum]